MRRLDSVRLKGWVVPEEYKKLLQKRNKDVSAVKSRKIQFAVEVLEGKSTSVMDIARKIGMGRLPAYNYLDTLHSKGVDYFLTMPLLTSEKNIQIQKSQKGVKVLPKTTQKVKSDKQISKLHTSRFEQFTDEDIARKYLYKKEACEKDGMTFTLSLASYIKLCKETSCYYTGMELNPKGKSRNSKLTFNALTIDRVDNTKGYVEGNVVACSHAANQLKAIAEAPGQLTRDQMISLLLKCKQLGVAGGD